jgi:nucleoid-associated protein EbfC
MFDGLKDMGKLMKQAKEMKSKMKDVQAQLKNTQVTGTALNDKIKVVLTGDMDCVAVNIDPTLFDANQGSSLENGLKKAFSEALKNAKTTASSQLSAISGGLNLPGL